MSFKKVLENEFKKNGDNLKIKKVPSSMRPTSNSLNVYNKEVGAQLEANKAMKLKVSRKCNF